MRMPILVRWGLNPTLGFYFTVAHARPAHCPTDSILGRVARRWLNRNGWTALPTERMGEREQDVWVR